LNEAKALPAFLDMLEQLHPGPYEIIVIDGGSKDQTLNILRQHRMVQVIKSKIPRRSFQMHEGANAASGQILCFLHADTFLLPESMVIMNKVLEDPTVAMGGFTSIMTGPNGVRQFTTFHNFIKTYYAAFLFRPFKFLFRGGRLLFGDQAIFCRRETYFKAGGFDPEMPIMEEADLCDRICQLGKIKQIPFPVFSSDRRVAKWGAVKANLIFLYIGFMWGIGYDPVKLHKIFTDIR
jgi:glycosyltransferase involved in cell wall biosynthesis